MIYFILHMIIMVLAGLALVKLLQAEKEATA